MTCTVTLTQVAENIHSAEVTCEQHRAFQRIAVRKTRAYLRTEATCAQGEAQRRVVMATPTKGSHAVNFFTKSWKNSLATTPTKVGTNTTWKVETARPCTTHCPGSTIALNEHGMECMKQMYCGNS